jgi:hypothetical protein
MADTTVGFGERAMVRGNRGHRIDLRGDGHISRSEAAGVERVDGFISSLFSPEVETFLRTQRSDHMPANWQIRHDATGRVTADSGDQLVGPWGTQQLSVDTATHTVVLDTQGVYGEHTIEARFDPRSFAILKHTIRETHAPVDLYQAQLYQGGAEG